MTETEMCDACNGSGFGVADTYCGKCDDVGGYPMTHDEPLDVRVLLEEVTLLRDRRREVYEAEGDEVDVCLGLVADALEALTQQLAEIRGAATNLVRSATILQSQAPKRSWIIYDTVLIALVAALTKGEQP